MTMEASLISVFAVLSLTCAGTPCEYAPASVFPPVSYTNAQDVSWEDLRTAAQPFGKSLLSVHVPIGLPESSSLVIPSLPL